MWKKIWRISTLKYIAAFLIPAIFLMFLNHSLDNDSWFVLAEGRQLVEGGIHYTDVLTMHDGLNIVVQNYGFAAIFYLVHSAFGAAGLYIMLLLFNFVVCYLIYKICRLISNKNINLSLFIMMMTDFLLILTAFVTTRAQMVSYMFVLTLIYLLELYASTNKTKYLWWVPVLSLLQINVHASMWWILIIILGVYIVDAIHKPKLHLQGYRMKPLVLTTIVSFMVGFINPYGLKMITYIFTSYGAPEITSMVTEMHPFDLKSVSAVLLYLTIVLVLVLYIFGDKRKVRIRYLLLFFGFLALGLNSMKGMSQLILVMVFPLALLYKDVRLESVFEARLARESMVFWVGIVSICIFALQCVLVIPIVKDGPSDDLVQVVDRIEQSSSGDKSIEVYVGYNNGGYVEYRGYKAYLDPRAEVFLKKNNGKEDILREWEEMLYGEMNLDDFLDKYEFDYLIVDKWHEKQMFELKREDYELIYGSDEGNVKVFKKR